MTNMVPVLQNLKQPQGERSKTNQGNEQKKWSSTKKSTSAGCNFDMSEDCRSFIMALKEPECCT